jgi:molybdopterin/thiamine biosynthesis adenylyltransferase
LESPTDRQERIAWWQQDLLRRAHVAVIGAGALGNEVLKNLALVGIGNISIFDFDQIELTNISRTVLFRSTDIGSPKASLAATRTRELAVESSGTIQGYNLDVVWQLGDGYLRRMDIVLGCLDNLEARLKVGETCYRFGIPYIDGGIRDLGGMILLHKTGHGACMSCTVGPEERLLAKQRYSCSQVMKSIVETHAMPTVQTTSAIVGSIMCQEALKYLHGRDVPFGGCFIWSGNRNEFYNNTLQQFDTCPTCQASPPRAIRELPITSHSKASELFDAAPRVFQFRLPGDYIISLTCQTCGRQSSIGKPAFRCRDSEMSCATCGSYSVALQRRETLDRDMDPELLAQQIKHFGIPPLAILFPSDDFQTVAYELTADIAEYPGLKERNSTWHK